MSAISVSDTMHQCVSQCMTYLSVGVGQHVDQNEKIMIDQIQFNTDPQAIGLGPVFNDKCLFPPPPYHLYVIFQS